MQAESSRAAAERAAKAYLLRHAATLPTTLDNSNTLDTLKPPPNARRFSSFAQTEHVYGRLVTPCPSPCSETLSIISPTPDERAQETDTGAEETSGEVYDAEGSLAIMVQHNKDLWGWGLYLRLENAGSVAKDHLGVETNFFAYLGASLALTSTGVALAQIMSLHLRSVHDDNESVSPTRDHHARAVYGQRLGAMAISLGLVVLFMGTIRFFSLQWSLANGRFLLAKNSILFIAAGFIMMLIAILGFIALPS